MNDAFFQPLAGRVACPARNSPTRRGSSWASSACSPLPPAATLSSRNTAPAAHEPRHDGVKLAVGHCYRLDRRGHQLRHRTVGEGRHEHDVTMLKRLRPAGLRQDVPKGRRVLLVYDRAALDFAFRRRCRHQGAVYFLSRVKTGMVFDWLDDRPLDTRDPRNRGVT